MAEVLADIADPKRVLIHMLMEIESDVVMDTLMELRSKGIMGLPMHDGIFVPASAEAIACELLRSAGERLAGAKLQLSVDRSSATAVLGSAGSAGQELD